MTKELIDEILRDIGLEHIETEENQGARRHLSTYRSQLLRILDH